MKTKRISVVTLLTVILMMMVVQSCNTPKQVTLNELNGLWVLKTLNGKDAKELFAREVPTFQFDFKAKRISGTGGCNRYTAQFILINNLLTAPNIASTERLCLDANAEDEFFKALRQDNELFIEEGILKMKNGKNVVLEFERGIESPKLTPAQQEKTYAI